MAIRVAHMIRVWTGTGAYSRKVASRVVIEAAETTIATGRKPARSPLAIAHASRALDRLAPGMETRQCFLLVASPHGGRDDARRAAFRVDSVAKMPCPIGAVGKDPPDCREEPPAPHCHH